METLLSNHCLPYLHSQTVYNLSFTDLSLPLSLSLALSPSLSLSLSLFLGLQSGPNDLRHFDPEFTDEPVPNSIGCSPDSALVTASIKDAAEAFLGFSYAPSMDSYL